MIEVPNYHPLSGFWRKNASTSEPMELANLLRALRKVAGHLGENVGRIEYMGMSHGDSASIVLDPAMVLGAYPVPPAKVDYLVGLVAHEALLKIEWTERVFTVLSPDFLKLSPLPRVIFQKLVKTGEDIFVDCLADRSILGKYVAQTRGRAMAEAGAKLRTEILTVDALLYLWWISTWSRGVERLLEPVYEKPLEVLKALTQRLSKVPDLEKSVTRRSELRAGLYRNAWEELSPVFGRLTLLDRRMVWDPSGPPKPPQGTSERRFSRTSGATALPQAMADRIETELAAHSSDITPIIRSIVGFDHPDVAPMSRWDFNIPAHPVVDPRMVGRLRALFINYARREKVVSRGLTSGRVDRRRLHRAPVNGRCFSQVDHLPVMDWNVTLLLDATGSMRGGKWRMVENTVGNLHKALARHEANLQAFAYFEVDGIVMFSRLIQGKKLHSVPPAGQTASGQAILAAAHSMPQGKGQNLIIHVTDGESNFGVPVEEALEYCAKRKIHLATLGCGTRDRDKMQRQYGSTIQFLNHFGMLPQAVERLLKIRIMKG